MVTLHLTQPGQQPLMAATERFAAAQVTCQCDSEMRRQPGNCYLPARKTVRGARDRSGGDGRNRLRLES